LCFKGFGWGVWWVGRELNFFGFGCGFLCWWWFGFGWGVFG